MVIIVQILYVLFCIGLAYINWLIIRSNERVYHGVNGAVHVLFWLAAYLATKEWLLLIILPILGRFVFDAALNTFRHYPLGYVSKTPKSIVDKLEQGLFGNDGYWPKVSYLISVIILNLFL